METTPARAASATTRRDADRALAVVCRRQFGVFSIRQALASGLPRSRVQRRVAAGRYERLGRGILRVAGAPDSRDARRMAALLHYGGDAVLARTTAAEVHGLPHGLEDDGLHLVVGTRTFEPWTGATVHRSSKLTAAHRTRIGPLRLTSVTWTVTDLAASLDAEDLRKLVSAAVRTGQTDARRLRELLDRRGRFRGRAALRRVLEELSPLEATSRSDLESLFLRVTDRAGIPPTAMNHAVRDADGGRRLLDAVYLPERLPVELDSRRFHGTLLDWHDDLRRENVLKLAGWRDPLRFSYADLRDRSEEVVATIRRALARTRADGPSSVPS
jgi:hypothetical protein